MGGLQKFHSNRPLASHGIQDGKLPAEISQMVDKLFEQMFGANPNLRSRFPTEQALMTTKRQWILGFAEHGVNHIDQLRQGMRQFRSNCQWLPSLSEFIGWCKTVDYAALGLPDEAELLRRLRVFQGCGMENLHEFKFRSHAEYWLITDLYCRCKTGEWRDKQLGEEAAKALAKMAKRIKRGEQIPPPTAAIEVKKREPLDPRIQRMIDEQNRAGVRQ